MPGQGHFETKKKKFCPSNMFRRLFSQQSTLLRKTIRNKTLTVLPKALAPTTLHYISSMSSEMPSLQQVNAFSTTSALERNFPVSKIENYDSSTYKTLAFYKFYPLTKPELEALKEKLLADFGELGIVGRIYISTEGINAQIACPEECLPKLQAYHDEYLKPMFDGDLMDLNIGTEHGKRSFRALHVRIRKQVNIYKTPHATWKLILVLF